MAPIYKIAVIQLHPKPLNPEANFLKASSFIASAASQGAHLAVLPEYHLTNWLPHDPRFAQQCTNYQTYITRYQSLARQHNICIVPGTIVESHPPSSSEEEAPPPNNDNDPPTLLNKAHFISSTGTILHSYTKKNLWHPERAHLTSSLHEAHEAFDTPLGKVGLLICWDLAFPEAFRELIAGAGAGGGGGGAKIIVVPTFWTLSDCNEYGLAKNPLSEHLMLESLVTARAYENTCCVVFVNAGAPVGGRDKGTYAGMSRVALPFVGAQGEETKGSREEGMSVVEVDMEILEQAEANYGVRGDLAKEGWHYTYRHQGKGRL